jgi:hypothetical protein
MEQEQTIEGNVIVRTERLKEWGYTLFCSKIKQLVEVTPVLTDRVE